MRIKIVILSILSIFLLTACNIDYNAEILDNGNVIEKLDISFKNDEMLYEDLTEQLLNEYLKEKITEFNTYFNSPLYDYKITYGKKKSNVELIYTYDSIREFEDKNISSYAFDDLNINMRNKTYKIKTDEFNGGYDNFEVDKLNVTLNTNKKIKDANYTKGSKFKGSYTWEFIYPQKKHLEFTLTNKENLLKKYFSHAPYVFYILVSLLIVIGIGTFMYIVYSSYKNKNAI